MNNKRVVSLGTNSMIYHKPGCRYEMRIKGENRMNISKHDAKLAGWITGLECLKGTFFH